MVSLTGSSSVSRLEECSAAAAAAGAAEDAPLGDEMRCDEGAEPMRPSSDIALERKRGEGGRVGGYKRMSEKQSSSAA